jgi:hypothetical protein
MRMLQVLQRLGAECLRRCVLLWFLEFADKFLHFFHSLFVKSRTDQDLPVSGAEVFLNILLGEKQGQGGVGLDLFLEELDCASFRFVHGLTSELRIALEEKLNATEKHEHDNDEENNTEATRRGVAPPAAVRPSRQSSHEG